MYCKFKSATELGERYIPGITIIDRQTQTNPSPEFLFKHGYKPVIHNPMPPEKLFYNIVPLYEDGAGAITNVWQYTEMSATEKVNLLKSQLQENDYKIIKCIECQLVGEALPYDIDVLHTERQALRDQINALEEYEGD